MSAAAQVGLPIPISLQIKLGLRVLAPRTTQTRVWQLGWHQLAAGWGGGAGLHATLWPAFQSSRWHARLQYRAALHLPDQGYTIKQLSLLINSKPPPPGGAPTHPRVVIQQETQPCFPRIITSPHLPTHQPTTRQPWPVVHPVVALMAHPHREQTISLSIRRPQSLRLQGLPRQTACCVAARCR